MKEGILYIQDHSREILIKLACAAVPLLALWVGVTIERSDRAVLIPLVLGIIADKFLMDYVVKKGWYFKTISWKLTDTEVTVGDQTFQRSEIERVTCMPKWGVQGKKLQYWELVIETEGRRGIWRSQAESAHAAESVEQFQQLAGLLDSNWRTYTSF